MRTRMLVVIVFTTILFIAGFGAMMSQPHARPETINGAEIADGLPQADGTRRS